MKTRKVNPLVTALNDSIKSTKADAHRVIAKARQLEQSKLALRAKYAGAFKDLQEGDTLWVSVNSYTTTIAVSLNNLPSFKDSRLVNMLEYFMQFTDKVSQRDWAQFLNKDFVFELDDVTVTIGAYVKSDSDSCRRVQVGTRLEETPVYQLQCD